MRALSPEASGIAATGWRCFGSASSRSRRSNRLGSFGQPAARYNRRLRLVYWLSGNGSSGFKNPQARYRFHPIFQEHAMAVQQNKKSPSKRGMHRSHNALNVPGIAVEPTTGEIHLRHHISPNGFYRGRQVLKNKSEA
jgi:large subunit ribosomal protein L32